MSEVIGGPFSKEVLNQIKQRQATFRDTNRNPQELQYLNSKTAWVRMVSSVNVAGNNSLATSTVLSGGLEGYNGTNSYILGEKGYRPMPGITSVSIRSINRFGILKEATVTFNCWDVAQLEDLDKLYMRPGFSVLLEWGNTYFIDNNKAFRTNIPSNEKNVLNPPGAEPGQNRRNLIYRAIEEKKIETGYNYDGIYGLIKNFSWKFRSDGGYDCTVVITSIGELVESLGIDIGVEVLGTSDKLEDSKKAEIPTVIDAIIREIVEKSPEEVWNSITELYPTFAEKYKALAPKDEKFTVAKYSLQQGEVFNYIRFDSFLNILNTILVCDQDKNPIIKLFSDTRSSKAQTSFRTYDYHISSDPGICLIAGSSIDRWKCDQETFNFVNELRRLSPELSDNSLLGIWVNTSMIQDAVKSFLINSNKQDRTLVKFLSSILSKINEALGGDFNALDLHYEEEESTFYIVDRNYRVKQDYPKLIVTGIGSTVTDFDFTSKLTPNLTTMLAVSAQINKTDVGADVENMFEWNRGLEDRVLGNKVIKTSRDNSSKEVTEEAAQRKKEQQSRFEVISGAIRSFFEQGVYNVDVFTKVRNTYGDFTREFMRFYKEPTTEAGPKGIIPFEGTVTLDGIAGIKIGQVFQINKGVMPSKYDDVTGFTVTGVDHTISNNRWETKLKAQIIIVKHDKSKLDFTETFVCKAIPSIIPTSFQGNFGLIGQPAPLIGNVTVGGDEIDLILATIRQKETGNNYNSLNFAWNSGKSTASGAYQFIKSTWQSLLTAYYKKNGIQNGQMYTFAYQAPPQLQDAVARMQVESILAKNGNSLQAVPNTWYTGNAQGTLSAKALAVNKGMSSSTYLSKWLAIYNELKASGRFINTVQGMQSFNQKQSNVMIANANKQDNIFTKIDNKPTVQAILNNPKIDLNDPWGLKTKK